MDLTNRPWIISIHQDHCGRRSTWRYLNGAHQSIAARICRIASRPTQWKSLSALQSLRPSLPLCWGRNRGGPACDTPTASIPESLLTLPALLSLSSRLAINVIVIISESHFSLLFGREMRCAKTLVRQCIAIQVCHSKCFSMCAYEY